MIITTLPFEAKADFATLDADRILGSISPSLRGEVAMQDRPLEVRIIFLTANTGNMVFIPNHGLPDNKPSEVLFDGQNALMGMLPGATAAKQLDAGNAIMAFLREQGVTDEGLTDKFIERHVVSSKGFMRQHLAQIYGPAPFEKQAGRLGDSTYIRGGQTLTCSPVRANGAVLGMRGGGEKPIREEAFLIVVSGSPENLFLKGGRQAATMVRNIASVFEAGLQGTQTAIELMTPSASISSAIVLAVDAGTGGTKPIAVDTAREIFDLARMPIIVCSPKGSIIAQLLPVPVETAGISVGQQPGGTSP